MKTIFKSLLIITIISFSVISCNEDDTTFSPLSYPEDAFVALQTSPVSVLESTTTPIEITVFYANTTEGSTSDVSVDFTITSPTGVEGTHYTIADNKTSLNFPAGTHQDTVTIIPIDNFDEDGDKVLTFTLGSSSVAVGYPGPEPSGISTTITLVDNDCAFTFADLDGIAWIGTDNSGSQGPNATQIVTSFDGINLLMEGIAYGWITGAYWNEVVIDSYPVVADMDPLSGEFTVAYQELCTTTWLGSPQTPYQISASGQYFSCLHSMVVNYTLYQGGSPLRQYTETIEY